MFPLWRETITEFLGFLLNPIRLVLQCEILRDILNFSTSVRSLSEMDRMISSIDGADFGRAQDDWNCPYR